MFKGIMSHGCACSSAREAVNTERDKDMRFLTLSNLKLALDHLLDVKAPLLATSQMGVSYKPLLEAKRMEIHALPEALTSKRPFALEIREADDLHDAAGDSLWHIAEALKLSPVAGAEEKAAAVRVQGALVPERRVLSAAHADEAAAAKKNREKLSGLEVDLKSIPYPGGKTAYDMALVYIEAGEKLDTLLQERANIKAGAELSERARVLRQATLKLVNNCRVALRDEVEGNAALPRNLEALLFGYFDELAERREENAGGKAGGDGEKGGEGSGNA